MANAITCDGVASGPGAPSEQGEQNAEICRELGFTDTEMSKMQANGSLVGNFTAQMISMVSAQLAARQAKYAEEQNEKPA